MRRAQLIGLAGIVVASGLWATPAVGQTSEPWAVCFLEDFFLALA